MNCVPSGISPAELIGWTITFAVGITGALLGAWLVLRSEKRKEIEMKRAEIREFQPKLNVTAARASSQGYRIRFVLVNKGGSPAYNLEFSLDGCMSKVNLQELSVNYRPPTHTVPVEVTLPFTIGEEICQREFANPKAHIIYHDHWFPQVEYKIHIPCKQRRMPDDANYPFIPNFDGSRQEPSWEHTPFSCYSNKQILEIWNKEKLGR